MSGNPWHFKSLFVYVNIFLRLILHSSNLKGSFMYRVPVNRKQIVYSLAGCLGVENTKNEEKQLWKTW